ncbi:MAG: ATP-binding protein [Gammaproteobacteria bacterium]|nr:ATP-binding protein [Gammaproteobacteria bacterium]
MDQSLKSLLEDATQLAKRLLKIVPEVAPVDWQTQFAAVWRGDGLVKEFIAHQDLDDIRLGDLLQIDDQKSRIERNTQQFLRGFPANNVLLWGARGTGKSSLVHALLNKYAGQGLRLVEVDKTHLAGLPEIAHRLREQPFRYLLFCDDLSFEADDASFKVLKSALEGSIFKSSSNLLIYATSNRRHLLPETMSDNESATFVEGELHQSEAVEEKISLSDRFGLWLSFYPFKQDQYIEVVRHWIGVLAERTEITVEWTQELERESLRWALARGVRSGRTAQYFARHWVGRVLLKQSPLECS